MKKKDTSVLEVVQKEGTFLDAGVENGMVSEFEDDIEYSFFSDAESIGKGQRYFGNESARVRTSFHAE